nr:hypothetical protein [uncultured Pseudoxanthomonas sp.]
MATWMKRLALVLALAVSAMIVLVVFGGFRLKDPQGNVAFGWHADERRFQIMEKPMLATGRDADAWRFTSLLRAHGVIDNVQHWRLAIGHTLVPYIILM